MVWDDYIDVPGEELGQDPPHADVNVSEMSETRPLLVYGTPSRLKRTASERPSPTVQSPLRLTRPLSHAHNSSRNITGMTLIEQARGSPIITEPKGHSRSRSNSEIPDTEPRPAHARMSSSGFLSRRLSDSTAPKKRVITEASYPDELSSRLDLQSFISA